MGKAAAAALLFCFFHSGSYFPFSIFPLPLFLDRSHGAFFLVPLGSVLSNGEIVVKSEFFGRGWILISLSLQVGKSYMWWVRYAPTDRFEEAYFVDLYELVEFFVSIFNCFMFSVLSFFFFCIHIRVDTGQPPELP